jgi:dUTP pyrophosphatase
MKIPFIKFYADAHSPTHNHEGDAGLDFYSIEYYPIKPHSHQVIKTGVAVQIPEGHVGLLFPKGKNDHLLGAGVIDTYYEGEILFKIVNFTDKVMKVHYGDAVGQMIIVPFVEPEPVEGWIKRSSERGDSGGIKKDLEEFIDEEFERALDIEQYA